MSPSKPSLFWVEEALFLAGQVLQPRAILEAFYWSCSRLSMFCTKGLKTGCPTLVSSSLVIQHSFTSLHPLPIPCWYSPGCCWSLMQWAHVQLTFHQNPMCSFQQICSPARQPNAQGFLSPCRALHVSLLNPTRPLLSHFSSLYGSLWVAAWPSSTLPLPLNSIPSPSLRRMCYNTTSGSTDKRVEGRSSDKPLGVGLQAEYCPLGPTVPPVTSSSATAGGEVGPGNPQACHLCAWEGKVCG